MPQTISPIIDSLGWALLHSLWQVTLIAALVAVTLRIVPRSKPELRFCVAYFGMVGALLAFLVTFFVGLKPATEIPVAAVAAAPVADDAVSAFLAMLGRSTGFVTFAWALGFGWLGTRYVRALGATRKLRREGITQVPELWQDRFQLWIERLGADRGTAILQSDRISTPITIGVFKPVVLVPAGFFLRLPTEQAEAILVHEIAHICRQDYLLGLFQAMIANIFFFHPAIYYLSRQIDIEREYACDDRAARETGRAGALAAGLSRITIDREAESLGFAMAANGRRTPIMDRINRLGGRPVAGDSEAGVPAAALVMVFAASMMIAVGAEASNGTTSVDSKAHGDAHDTADPAKSLTPPAEASLWPVDAPGAPAEMAVAPSAPQAARPATGPNARAEAVLRDAAQATPHIQRIVSRAVSLDHGFPVAVRPVENAAKLAPVRLAAATQNVRGVTHAVAWRVDYDADHNIDRNADCEETERARERAIAHAERQAARAERNAERIEREMERRADEIERIAEQRAERFSAEAERRAEQLERQMEALAERREAMIERQAEQREAMFERQAEQRERAIERRERERERQRTRVVISFNAAVPQPPAAPHAPAPLVAISYSSADTL